MSGSTFIPPASDRLVETNGDSRSQGFTLPAEVTANGSGREEAVRKSFEATKIKAEKGDIQAEYGLGDCYATGRGVTIDNAQAVFWLRKAADRGFAKAQVMLGVLYECGSGVPEDAAEAAKWYRKAANQGDIGGQTSLAACYLTGEGVLQDYAEAAKWLRKAAKQGDAGSEVFLGLCYAMGQGVSKDDAEALTWYRKAAGQGNASAEVLLGNCYANGQGVPQDCEEAIKWYRKAADQGDTIAQTAIGSCYASGQGVPQDYTEAVTWYRRAADAGYVEAESKLGLFYANGWGMQKDYAEAALWYQAAAEKGNAEAQRNLGDFYATGEGGVRQDNAEAVKWYGKAAAQGDSVAAFKKNRIEADQGDASAQFKLGYDYNIGQGVKQDYSEAVKWYHKAAEQGDAKAQLGLGLCYSAGTGVPQNDIEAYVWLSISAANGVAYAPFARDNVAQRMSREEIAEGQRQAAAFVPNAETPDASSGISTSHSDPTATGTGFFITDDGYFVTCAHVVENAKQIRLMTSDGTVPAKVVQVDTADDLALVKADGKFSALPIGLSRLSHLGENVATIGFPDPSLQGFSPKLAKGIIAGLAGAADDARYFQISVPVQPGNSGGALVDERGNVAGIVSAKLDAATALAASGALPENVNYAVKSSFLLSFLESVPDVEAKLKKPNLADEKFEDVVNQAESATVMVLVY